MKYFNWNCSATSLVDGSLIKFNLLAPTIVEATEKLVEYIGARPDLELGTHEIHMDIAELACSLGNIASENDDDWVPLILTEELEKMDKNSELIATLEWIVCNNNK